MTYFVLSDFPVYTLIIKNDGRWSHRVDDWETVATCQKLAILKMKVNIFHKILVR